jgi:hypothetical protein
MNFRKVVFLVKEGSHLNRAGLENVISLSYQINSSGKRK